MRKALSALLIGAFLSLSLIAPARAASPTVSSVWTALAHGATSISVNVSPTSGDTIVAILYTYNSGGCPTLTVPTGFTEQGTPACVASKNETHVLTKTAGSDTSYSFTVSSTSYLALTVYDVSGANGLDGIVYSAFTGTTNTTASLTPTGTDLAIASWGTGYSAPSSISAGLSEITNNGGVYQESGSEAVSSASSFSATWTTAPASGQDVLVLLKPAAVVSGLSVKNSWKTYVNNATSVAVTVAPTAGDLIVAVLYTYNSSACPTVTASGFTEQGSPTCANSKNETHVFTKIAGSNDTSYSFTLSSSSYANVTVLDIAGANTTTPVDQMGYAAFSGTTTNTTPAETAAQTDLAIAEFGNGYSQPSSITSGYTAITNSGGVYQTTGYALESGSVSASGTWTTAPTSGQSAMVLIAPAPTASVLYNPFLIMKIGGPHVPTSVVVQNSQSVIAMTPVYGYVQSTSACGGGYDGIDATAAQDDFWGIEMCQSDASWPTTAKKWCPTNTNCRIYLYYSASQNDCHGGETAEASWLESNPGSSDSNFIHTGSPTSSSNRFTTNIGGTGACTSALASGGPYWYYPNITGSATTSGTANWWVQQNIIDGSSWNNADPYVGEFWDNMSPSWSDFGAYAYEVPNDATWDQDIATFANQITAPNILNHDGPGAGAFGHNNTYGVVNWAVPDSQYCDSLTGTNVKGELFEKLIGNTETVSGTTYDYFWPHNFKIAVNTAANHWADSNCANINMLISGMTGMNGTTSWTQRAFAMALKSFMTPNDYDGARTTPGVVMGPDFTENISGTSENPIFPEYELVPTNPIQQLSPWTWGTGQSNSDAYGNGCYTADSGGVNGFAQLCGSVGTDADGGTAPVYVREFSDCYQLGTDIGPCAFVYNASTSVNVTISQLSLTYAYSKQLLPTGTELYDDPVHGGHHLCSSSSLCTGAWATQAVSGSTVIPHATVSGSGASSTIDMMSSPSPVMILLH